MPRASQPGSSIYEIGSSQLILSGGVVRTHLINASGRRSLAELFPYCRPSTLKGLLSRWSKASCLARVTIERMSSDEVPSEIVTEAGELISELRSVGWTVQTAQFDARLFGNWFVDLRSGGRTLRLVKDRSQFMVAGPPTTAMKEAGLWQAFGSFEEFRDAIKKWAVIEDD